MIYVMCGIYGILYTHNIYQHIMNGLSQLQNRGYDSSGLCGMKDGSFHILKSSAPNPLDVLVEQINTVDQSNIRVGMGHNRWATHGGNTNENAHPHLSNNGRWAIVHNGIIENYAELKTILKGYTFYSQTDTEVVCNLLQHNYEGNVYNAIEKTLGMIKGTYAFIIMCLDEQDHLYCVKNQSPLLIGYDNDKIIITSEKSGFCFNVRYIILKDNDICCINKDVILYNEEYKEYEHIYKVEGQLKYPHWTLKEIHEQPEAVLRIQNIQYELDVDNIILLGCGTSYHAALYGAKLFKQSGKYNTVQVFDGAEFTIEDIPKTNTKTAYIFISQSGETIDLYQCLRLVTGPTVGIINVEDSLIAREVNHAIYTNAGKEVGVASMKTFTNQVVCLAILAGVKVDLPRLSADIQTTINISIPICQSIASNYTNNLFILGKGTDEIIAKEGALKIKEISYIHAEGYSASSLKHGPFALLDENMPTLIIDIVGDLSSCYHEVKSRNSPIFYITNRPNDKADLVIPEHSTLSSLLAIIPLQLLAYYISVNKGINPDKPKNLAKVVTVL